MIVVKTILFFMAALAFGEAAEDTDEISDLKHTVNRLKRQEEMWHQEIKTLIKDMAEKMTNQEEVVLNKLEEITTHVNDMCPTLPDSNPTIPGYRSPLADYRLGFDFIPYGNITFSPYDSSSIKKYTDLLDDFIERYEGHFRDGQKIMDCYSQNLPWAEHVCKFQDTWLGEYCQKAENWGFRRSQPCLLLTYHNDLAFEPEVYTSMDNLPSDIPDDLKMQMGIIYEQNDGQFPQMVWVYCTNATAYSPWHGFPSFYFPNKDLDYYLPPIVGVSFDLTSTDILEVECSQWDITSDKAQRTKLSFTITKTP